MLALTLGFILILISFLLLLIIVGFFFYLFDAFLDLPYVATRRNKVSTIIDLSGVKPGETAVDLGSGDGRLLIAAAKQGAYAIGYEINPMLVWITRVRSLIQGYSVNEVRNIHKNSSRFARTVKGSVNIYRSDLWKADLKQADVIFVYARQGTMQKMENFVFKFAKRGARIIVNTDLTKPFPSKKPIKSENGIFLYKV